MTPRTTSDRVRVGPRFAALAVVALATAVPCVAHEDDPKASVRHIPVLGPAWREADGGLAADTFASSGVVLKAWFPVNNFDGQGVVNSSGNDCWGYVSPSGREYAIMGLSGGTGFVEVTDPGNSQIVGFIPGPNSLWRNVKSYDHYAYAVSEGGGGIQVFDLAEIDSGIVTQLESVTTGGNVKTHTMAINTETGYLYRMGGGSNGLRVYSLANPASPTFVGSWSEKYTHNGCVRSFHEGPWAGKEIYFACGGFNGGFTDTGVDILDVTNKSNIQSLAHFTYAGAAFCHQAWLTPDLKHLYIDDEIDEQDFGVYSTGRIVNVEDLENPFLVGTYTTGLTTVDHNLFVRDHTMYCSNYKSGIQIFDVTDQTNPVRIAWFDTYPENDSGGYSGLWSNYPFFPSGTVIGSDIERGLFVWRVELPVATFTYPSGLPAYIDPAGGQTLDVVITPNEGQTLVAGSESLLVAVGTGSYESYPLEALGDGAYRATFPAFDCGATLKFAFSVTGESGVTTTAPPGGANAFAALGDAQLYSDEAEVDNGWIVGVPSDGATSGIWVLADPVGTVAQPEDDHTPSGTQCWITGNGAPGGDPGAADVDFGATTLTSPAIDCSEAGDPTISYWRWYSNDQGGSPNTDVMPVLISGDDGVHWALLEQVTENAGTWVQKSFRVADYVTPSNKVRLRFIAQDQGAGSLVEAGVDDITVTYLVCPDDVFGDLDGDGGVGPSDLAILLGQWGSDGSADLDGSGIVDGADLALLLGSWA